MQIHGADYLFSFLRKLGVKHIFGIPGDELEIFDALGHSEIEFITTRHEQGAAFMAEAVGKVTSLPGVCISTLGPGATNLATGVANAYQNRVPLLVLSGQLEKKYHTYNPLPHQYVDLQKFFKPITKETYVISNLHDMESTIVSALKKSKEPRPGPVHVTLPIDVMEENFTGGLKSGTNIKFVQKRVGGAEINRAIKTLGKSRLPLIFLGREAQYAHPSFSSALLKSNIPVITSFLGKGSFPENNPMSLGVISRHVKDKLVDVLKDADLLLIFGYDYIEGIPPDIFAGKKIIYIDSISAKKDRLLKPDVELVGDVSYISQKFARKIISSRYKTSWSPGMIKEISQERLQKILDVQKLDSFPFNPFKIIHTLQEVARGDEVIVSDVGIHKQVIALGYKAKSPLDLHFSNGLSSMGFSLPFAAGLRFSLPADKVIISINGDGGFLMNVQELETIKRYNLDIKIIVMFDNAFGMIKENLVQKYQRVRCLDFTNPDYKYLAKSFGIRYMAVDKKSDLKMVLKSFLSSRGATLLAIPIKYS